MPDEEKFVMLSALVCEPTRARMLWSLLDGRAYTASELAITADISATSASNHLTKMLEADLVKVEVQGRHRYFSFSRPEVAYAIESLANLSSEGQKSKEAKQKEIPGVRYCRTCYDHLAGFVGVRFAEALEAKKIMKKSGNEYIITSNGWDWLKQFDISKESLPNKRRAITRQCLDWSERKPHLAGQLGALLLDKMLERNWFRKIRSSRELIITHKGRQDLYSLLRIEL